MADLLYRSGGLVGEDYAYGVGRNARYAPQSGARIPEGETGPVIDSKGNIVGNVTPYGEKNFSFIGGITEGLGKVIIAIATGAALSPSAVAVEGEATAIPVGDLPIDPALIQGPQVLEPAAISGAEFLSSGTATAIPAIEATTAGAVVGVETATAIPSFITTTAAKVGASLATSSLTKILFGSPAATTGALPQDNSMPGGLDAYIYRGKPTTPFNIFDGWFGGGGTATSGDGEKTPSGSLSPIVLAVSVLFLILVLLMARK